MELEEDPTLLLALDTVALKAAYRQGQRQEY